MQKIFFNLLLLSLIGLYAPSTLAHHSFAATFKDDETSSVDGVVTDFKFRNPHVLIYLDVTNADGSLTQWMAEGSSATSWRRSGWQNDSIKVGDTMRISGSATIDGSPMVAIDEMYLLDPATRKVVAELSSNEDPQVSLGRGATAQQEAAPYFIPLTRPGGEPNFTGRTMQTSNRNISPATSGGPDGNDAPMPYNETGLAALQAWDLTNDPQVFCDPPGVVRQAGYTPYGFILNQYDDHITIEYEEYGTRRSVFFDDELPKPGVRSHMGDSVARYEGDSLIIETVNLLPNASGHRGKPLSENARVTEVYTRIDHPEAGSAVKVETTVVDPTFLTEPWTITRYKAYSPDYEYIENECEPPLRERPANVFQYSDFDLQFID